MNETPQSGGEAARSYGDERLLAGSCLFGIYVALAPLLSACLIWAFNMLFVPPSGFLNLGRSLVFWLFIAFVGAAPVLLATALVHFWFRFKPLPIVAACVFATGVLGWTILALILNPGDLFKVVLPGLVILGCTFVLAYWACRRFISILPPPSDSRAP